MTIKFIPPTIRSDYMGAIKALVTGAVGLFSSDAVTTVEQSAELWTALKGNETNTPENLAWVWLNTTIIRAANEFAAVVARDHMPMPGKRDDAIAAFLEKAMPEETPAMFDDGALRQPASHPAFAPARDAVIELVLSLTRITKFDEESNEKERYLHEFDRCLNRASAYVYSANYDRLSSLEAVVSGPAAQAMRREAAWARHYDWIHRKVDTEPVFSPDGSVKVPLKPLYLRPRSYWHEELPQDDDAKDQPRYRVHLCDLHEHLEEWLDADDRFPLRLVAGGPGSGKSSFARVFASETIQRDKCRVIFVELQHMHKMSGDLLRDIADYLKMRRTPGLTGGSAGFPEDALGWVKDEARPLLLVFDGLDELSFADNRAAELTRQFILNVNQMLTTQNAGQIWMRALVLGRNAAIQSGIQTAGLPRHLLLNVAPIRALVQSDLGMPTQELIRRAAERCEIPNFGELSSALIADQRPDYWRNWSRTQGQETPPPEAITHSLLSGLNVEPLLLHLLILSDFCGDRWQEAAKNRNLVYEDILCKVHARNATKRSCGQNWSQDHFFRLMEALGIAAWRGNGRAGTESTFIEVRDLHAGYLFKKGKSATPVPELDSVVLQTHARQTDGPEAGFEFIHKSFGEYLVARGLVTAAIRLDRRYRSEDNEDDQRRLALDWARLVRDAAFTREVIRFVYDEARRRTAMTDLTPVKETLEDILNWVQDNGVPVQELNCGLSFRELETCQRCAEAAMLAVASAIAEANRSIAAPHGRLVSLKWNADGPKRFLERLMANDGGLHGQILRCLDLSCSHLSDISLSDADLSGADLSGATLNRAELSDALLFGVNLSNSTLRGAHLGGAHLDWADMTRADLKGANLHDARLTHANLSGAILNFANLTKADFSKALLDGAKLDSSHLNDSIFNDADLTDCYMEGASARSVDFQNTNLTAEQVEQMFGVKQGKHLTILPDGLAPPNFWHVETEAETKTRLYSAEYIFALNVWRQRIRYKYEVEREGTTDGV